MQALSRHLPLPLATVILLAPAVGLLRAGAQLDELRQSERRQRQLTEAAIAAARPILAAVQDDRPAREPSDSEHG